MNTIHYLHYADRLRITTIRPPDDEILLASTNTATLCQLVGARRLNRIRHDTHRERLIKIYSIATENKLSITSPPSAANLGRSKRIWLE